MGVTGMSDYEISCQEFDRSVLVAILKAVSKTPHKDADDFLNRSPSFQHGTRAVASMTRETAINAASYILTIEAAIVHFGALLNGRRNEALAVMYLNANNRLIGEGLWARLRFSLFVLVVLATLTGAYVWAHLPA